MLRNKSQWMVLQVLSKLVIKLQSTATKGTIKAGDKVTIDGKDGKIAAGKVSVVVKTVM